MSKRFSEKQRVALLARFERREGSAAAFCRKFRLSYQTLRGWQRAAAQSSQKVESPGFVEVELAPQLSASVAPVEARRAPVAELELGAGIILRVYPIRDARS